jgi:hypothetical protein
MFPFYGRNSLANIWEDCHWTLHVIKTDLMCGLEIHGVYMNSSTAKVKTSSHFKALK